MFYEEVEMQAGETLWGLANAYGYKGNEWKTIWDDPRNRQITQMRGKPEKMQINDLLLVPIPWEVVYESLTQMPRGAEMIAERDGELGERLTWVQTVYQHNQSIGKTGAFCVDGCPADDNLPFYWTADEVKANSNLRKRFEDYSSRNPPTKVMGTTQWRAVLSLAVVTKRRVTCWNSIVWGWNMTSANDITIVGPRKATAAEVSGHLNLLRKGLGTGPMTFGNIGWTFRTAPAPPKKDK